MASSSNRRGTREDYKKQQELEELRKIGVAPAEVDEEGNIINPHIPKYIADAPWYLQTGAASLKHQRQAREQKAKASINEFQRRGVRSKAATKFRKGACANCGAKTHKSADCLERPRKKGAKWTQKDIAPDEIVSAAPDGGYDGKRDHWASYDLANHARLIKLHEDTEQERKAKRTRELDAKAAAKREKRRKRRKLEESGVVLEPDSSDDSDDLWDESADEEVASAKADIVEKPGDTFQKKDEKQRQSVRNLRIREDVPKYLLNLDVDSALYDAKTRAMLSNPHEGKDPSEVDYAGDKWVRAQGDVQEMARVEAFARQASQVSAKQEASVNMIANPTRVEKAFREFEKKKSGIRKRHHQALVDRYGGAEHMDEANEMAHLKAWDRENVPLGPLPPPPAAAAAADEPASRPAGAAVGASASSSSANAASAEQKRSAAAASSSGSSPSSRPRDDAD